VSAYHIAGDPPRIRVRTVLIPAGAAVVPAAIVSWNEIRVVGRAWHACEIGSTGPNGFVLLYTHLPALWLVQTLAVTGVSVLIAWLFRNRLVATGGMALAAAVIVAVSGWTYLVVQGLPAHNEFCPGIEPPWWPS
jgi:hypothetical protein